MILRMNKKIVTLIPIVDENPNLFKTLYNSLKYFERNTFLFVINSGNNYNQEFRRLGKQLKLNTIFVTEKKRAQIYKEGYKHLINNNIDFDYILSLYRYKESYKKSIINGLLEVQDKDFDLVYCHMKLININITLYSPIFIAAKSYLKSTYYNPLKKVGHFYHKNRLLIQKLIINLNYSKNITNV